MYAKSMLIVLFLALGWTAKAQPQTYKAKSVIRDPLVYKYCSDIIKKRNKKAEFRKGLLEIIKKNKEVLATIPPAKKTIKSKLERNLRTAQISLQRTIKTMNSLKVELIRQGCPENIMKI